MANRDVWDAVEQTEGTPANSFEMLVAVKPAGGSSFIRSGDIVNVNPAFTPKMRARQTYAAKGVNKASKYGDDLAFSFDVELVRDLNGQFQAFAQDLINASKVNGVDNRRDMQVYDALGADYAFQGNFAISVSRSGTGWDDSAFITVTATPYGDVDWITNPVLTGNVPIIESVLPTGRGATQTIYIQGHGFANVVPGTPSNVTIGGTNATSFVVINDELITAVVPTGAAGVVAVAVHNPAGTTSVQYTRAV